MTSRYVVSARPGPCWAVLAEGPRGGTRLVAVYADSRTAESVAAELNRLRKREV